VTDLVALDGAGWRIAFERRGDRWAHRVELEAEGRFQPLFSSVEGSGDESWPASPPFQQLHFEDRPGGGRVALLVGMAGRSHWSASIEVQPDRGSAVFDVACRHKERPIFLGSCYRAAAGCAVVQQDRMVTIGAMLLHVEPSTVSPVELVLDGQEEFRLAVSPAGDAGPQTSRWRYRLAPPGTA
jgi:hypothetical protein